MHLLCSLYTSPKAHSSCHISRSSWKRQLNGTTITTWPTMFFTTTQHGLRNPQIHITACMNTMLALHAETLAKFKLAEPGFDSATKLSSK